MTNLHVGSCLSPGGEALHVLVRSDGNLEIVANDGAVIGDEVRFERHVLTVEREQAFSLGSLLLHADTLIK